MLAPAACACLYTPGPHLSHGLGALELEPVLWSRHLQRRAVRLRGLWAKRAGAPVQVAVHLGWRVLHGVTIGDGSVMAPQVRWATTTGRASFAHGSTPAAAPGISGLSRTRDR